MNPQEINLAICEKLNIPICIGCLNQIDPDNCYCGSCKEDHPFETGHYLVPSGCTCGYADQISVSNGSIPNFYEDLNLCAEMEKSLDWTETCLMRNFLDEICEKPAKREDGSINLSIKRVWQASAPQRCEAFLKTFELWKQNP